VARQPLLGGQSPVRETTTAFNFMTIAGSPTTIRYFSAAAIVGGDLVTRPFRLLGLRIRMEPIVQVGQAVSFDILDASAQYVTVTDTKPMSTVSPTVLRTRVGGTLSCWRGSDSTTNIVRIRVTNVGANSAAVAMNGIITVQWALAFDGNINNIVPTT